MRFLTAFAIRIAIIIATEIMKNYSDFEYTDIDYHVFSDGAKHIAKLESPYNRETYRYTPLLAFFMIPNNLIHYSIGKIIFSFFDILNGLLIEVILNLQNKQTDKEQPSLVESVIHKKDIWKKIYGYIDNPYVYASLFYLYNPLAINICTRGSADCLIVFFVLVTVVFIELGLFPISGIIYGFAVHFKIYPIIYAPALYLYLISKDSSKKVYVTKRKMLDESKEKGSMKSKRNNIIYKVFNFMYDLIKITMERLHYTIKLIFRYSFNFKSAIFAILAIFTFCSFLVGFYILLGNQFLHEYLIYHVVRKDHRHNYSMFYYLIYLTYDNHFSKLLSLITFIPQAFLIFLTSIFLFKDINLCLVVQTIIFVTFNKVITAQYFLWYFSLLPLIIPFNQLFNSKVIRGILLFILWLIVELVWNHFSHLVEYEGQNTFLSMWIIDVIFFLINCYCIKDIVILNK